LECTGTRSIYIIMFIMPSVTLSIFTPLSNWWWLTFHCELKEMNENFVKRQQKRSFCRALNKPIRFYCFVWLQTCSTKSDDTSPIPHLLYNRDVPNWWLWLHQGVICTNDHSPSLDFNVSISRCQLSSEAWHWFWLCISQRGWGWWFYEGKKIPKIWERDKRHQGFLSV
jgi:hypothetical protein